MSSQCINHQNTLTHPKKVGQPKETERSTGKSGRKRRRIAILAALLIMVAYSMSGWKTIAGLAKHRTRDFWVLVVTFFLTVIFDLTVAIEVGLLLAMVLFLMRTNELHGGWLSA